MRLGFTDDAVLKSLMAFLEALDGQIGVMDAKIASIAINDGRVKLLMTMPGLDYFAASLLLAEMCDVNRFSSDRRLVAWAGLAPSIHQSEKRLYTAVLAGAGISLSVELWLRLLRIVCFMLKRNEPYRDKRRELYGESLSGWSV